jgi:uncharacterized protein (TIGR02270 family)
VAARAPIISVVQQHAEETALLRSTRSVLTRAPHVKLHQLRRIDDRIAAHLDGLAVAGDVGWRLAEAALENPGHGEVFAVTVRAIEDRNRTALEKLLALGETLASAQRGLISAFGWVSPHSLRGVTKWLLDSRGTFPRSVGLAACAMHQVDPGAVLTTATLDTDAALRIRALRTAGECARNDLLPACKGALSQADPDIQFVAARSALLLGDRGDAPARLHGLALKPGPYKVAALSLLLKVCTPEDGHALFKTLAQDVTQKRLLIHAVGVAGDPHYVPWLIREMGDLGLARLAGESFSLISGADLAALDLERKPPEGIEPGPNEDPNDADVAMDEDDGLPWPNPAKVAAWWSLHGARYESGKRYFLGERPSVAHCLNVLRNGFQRQRLAAAQYRCLLRPGTPLFGTAAPAWRQERMLAQLAA